MLLELTIRNIALIESLRIEFTEGFNVLTGETGAGKSIVVDSLNLALGGRADRELIRAGADKASVQALFDISENQAAIAMAQELGVEVEDGLIAVLRELSKSGRNICRISGVIVPLAALKEFTALLVDIHGQHEHQALLDPQQHIHFLDAYGKADHHALRERVSELYGQRTRLAGEIRRATADAAQREREADMLAFQVNEIFSAKLKPGEEEKLKRKNAFFENAEKIQGGVESAYNCVYRGVGRGLSAQELLSRAADALEGIQSLDERFSTLCGRLRELYYAAQDVGYELQDLLEGLDYNPATAEKVADRLDLIGRLERKYGPELDDVIAFGENAKKRLDALNSGEENAEAMRSQLQKLDAALEEASSALTVSRKALAAQLTKDVLEQFKDLGMGKARFEIRISQEASPGAEGIDRVEFMTSMNPGGPLKPLHAVVSGGELARIMLALKVISMNADGVDCMVFDEIDTGVSGRMAQVVGEKMCLIASERQVLCVTHLPQIAALGDTHFVVEKLVGEDRTDSSVRRLDDEGRVHELSRFVSGAEDSESSLSHGRHMLSQAEEIRRRLRGEAPKAPAGRD